MMLNFKNFFESFGAGSFLPTSWTGSEGDSPLHASNQPVMLPSTDMVVNNDLYGVPTVKKTGIVKHFSFNENPIKIELQDGTKIYMSFEQYKRISGDLPIVPNNTELTVTFQRLPTNKSSNTSKIVQCKAKFIGPNWLRKHKKVGYSYKP